MQEIHERRNKRARVLRQQAKEIQRMLEGISVGEEGVEPSIFKKFKRKNANKRIVSFESSDKAHNTRQKQRRKDGLIEQVVFREREKEK